MHQLPGKSAGLTSKSWRNKKCKNWFSEGRSNNWLEQPCVTKILQTALQDYPKYQLTESVQQTFVKVFEEENKSWIEIYKPIMLIFGYILGITQLVEYINDGFIRMR